MLLRRATMKKTRRRAPALEEACSPGVFIFIASDIILPVDRRENRMKEDITEV
jgi:hypothetical protein